MPFGASRAGLMSVAVDDIPDNVENRAIGYYNAIDTSTIDDLDNPTQWDDQTDNDNHVSGTAEEWDVDACNGNGGIVIRPAENQRLEVDFPAESQPNTWFLVLERNDFADDGDWVINGDPNSSNEHALRRGSGGDWSLQNDIEGGSITESETVVLTCVFDTGNSLIRKNGSEVASGTIGDETMEGLILGNNTDDRSLGVNLGAFVNDPTRASESEIDEVEEWLSDQFDVTLS